MQMKTKSVKYNFVMNSILTVSSIVFPLITFPYVSRVLTVDGYGITGFATSVMTYFMMFASLGIPTYGIRVCAQVRDNKKELSKTVQELLIINTVTTVFAFAVFLISLFIIPKFSEQKTLLLINSISLWLNVIGVNWLYSALEQYSYITMRSLVFKVISIILMFWLVRQSGDYIVYGAISVLASAGSNVLNFINLKKFVTLKHEGTYNFRRHMKPIFIFFATSAATSVYTNLDTLMLGFISGDTPVGYYNAAIKIKSVLISLVTSLGAVLLPRLSYYIKQDLKDEFRNIVSKAFNFVFIIATGLTIYFTVFAKESILFLSGEKYLGSVLPMQLLMPTILFIGLSNVTGIQILLPMGKEKKVLISIIWGAAINLLLNLFLIPQWQAVGTSFSTLVAELVVLMVQSYYLRDEIFAIFQKLSLRKILVAASLSTAAGIVMSNMLPYRPFVKLVISSIVFFAIYFGTLMIQKESFVMEMILPVIKSMAKRLKPGK